jgi:hypothetical protein
MVTFQVLGAPGGPRQRAFHGNRGQQTADSAGRPAAQGEPNSVAGGDGRGVVGRRRALRQPEDDPEVPHAAAPRTQSGGAGTDLIRTESNGYRLVTAPGQLDLDHFLQLTTAAAAISDRNDCETERELLVAALALWHATPPLSNVEVPPVARTPPVWGQ